MLAHAITPDGYDFAADLAPRPAMLAAARSLIGSPYRFKGEGDCFDAWSFLRECAARATGRADLMDVARASADWDAVAGATAQTAFVQWGLREVRAGHAEPGDVLLFATGAGVHAAILSDRTWPTGERAIIHAYQAKAAHEAWLKADGSFAGRPVASAWTFDRPRPSFFGFACEIANDCAPARRAA